MAPKNALFLVAGSAFLFATIGALAGFLLGRLMPGYYRSVFTVPEGAFFDPVAVGIGQGLGQGLVLGAVVGLILVGYYMFAAKRTGLSAGLAAAFTPEKDGLRGSGGFHPTDEENLHTR